MSISDIPDDVIQDRAIRLFTFLKELSRLQTKTTRDLSTYAGHIFFHEVPNYRGLSSILSQEAEEAQDEVWLEVRRPTEPKRPPFPPACLKWLDDNYDTDPLVEPTLKNEIPISESQTSRLSDYPEITDEWQEYIQNLWEPWAVGYKTWKAAIDIYFRLFSIHEQLVKLGEKYELLLGLGLLKWDTPNNQRINRHIIVGDAYLTFDADRAKFEVKGAPEGIRLRLETEMVDPDCLPSSDLQKEIESHLNKLEESPWDKDELGIILRSWVQSISPEGKYIDSLTPPEEFTKSPVITYAPVIILRQRTQRSQIQCFEKITEQISNEGTITPGVRLLCEISEDTALVNDDQERTGKKAHVDTTLYLPLKVNEEQIQIIHQTANRHGILVQGPPGTGKSHTIANLICHLLAKGKRVLVTSQTPRALRVLKDKIPDEVSALCVTLLGNDQAAREELRGSVQSIQQKSAEWNPLKSKEKIEELETHLYKVRRSLADRERLLRELREIQTYKHQGIGGKYDGTAQEIAQRLAKEEAEFTWLSDSVDIAETCPLSNAEFQNLLQLYREISKERCSELEKDLVSTKDLPGVTEFIKLSEDEKAAVTGIEKHKPRHQSHNFSVLKQVPEENLFTLSNSVSALITAISSIKQRFPWISQAISDILSDNDAPWKSLRDFIKDHLSGLKEKAISAQANEIKIPKSLSRKTILTDAHDLLDHLQKGGGLRRGPFASSVVKRTSYFKHLVKVNGQPCLTTKALTILINKLELLDGVDLVWSAFKGIDERTEGLLLIQVGYLEERLEALNAAIDLENYYHDAKARITDFSGLSEPQWQKNEEREAFVLDIEAAKAEIILKTVRGKINSYIQKILIKKSSPNSHSLNEELLIAIEGRDPQALGKCYEKLKIRDRDLDSLFRRDELYERLSKSAPTIASHLVKTFEDGVWDRRAQEFEDAWAWKRTVEWLRQFNQEHDRTKLESEIRQLNDDESRTISHLAAEKAWKNCLENLTEHQRTNLIAWEMAVRKIGKGTGKYAPKWRREAQKYMDECKSAIPAWIMPLYRVFETVKPEPHAFDVIIVDEASQTGPEGLVIEYLGKQCIVVGDEKQISPDAVGFPREVVNSLIKRYLHDIPFSNLYDPQSSLFAHAELRFKERIVLREHFRCMPEIIRFSNNNFYPTTPLKPLRQYPPKRLEPLQVRYVKEGFREGDSQHAVNRPEGDELVETIQEICSKEEYKDKTIGVISLQGDEQAKYIESRLISLLPPVEWERRRLVCGDAYAFQGDERDIVFLSMVAAPNARIKALTGDADARRFNVAASRGKDQVWLFHTATLNDLHPGCMRHKLLEYYLKPERITQEVDFSLCESQFEKDVCEAIHQKGYKVIPQYRVASYRIDMVIEGERNQLAVECDGDEWHGIDVYEKDVARQRILERCGWRFWRIRGCEYYRAPDKSLEPLWKILSEMGIYPIGESVPDEEKLQPTSPIDNRPKVKPDSSEDDIEESQPLESQLKTPHLLFELDNIVQESKVEKSKPTEDSHGSSKAPSVEKKVRAAEKQKQGIQKKVIDSEIYNYSPEFFFKLSHWAKEKDMFHPWERRLIFKCGDYLQRGWKISEKMDFWLLKLIKEAKEAGFSEKAQ